MSRDLLRRSRVLVVCGHAVTESVKNDIAVAQRLKITATTLPVQNGEHRPERPGGALTRKDGI